jgi:putative ABC transport system ATP-binding protein
MIQFKNVSLTLHKQLLLDKTDLQVALGDHMVIRGSSGCGKSSLLKIAVGALPMSAGTVKVAGLELSAKTVADIRSQIAFIGQEPILGADSVKEALLLPFSFKAHQQTKPSDDLIFQTLERLHLAASILDKPSKRISGGEKQRIAIARALLLNKTVFFADEITSALDPESKQAVMAELFRQEITMLSVSHDPDWINASNRIVEIQEYKLIEVPR